MIASAAVWGLIQVALADTLKTTWYPYFGAWIFAFVSEATLLGLSAKFEDPSDPLRTARFVWKGLRLALFLAVALGVLLVRRYDIETTDEENAPLICPTETASSAYGAIDDPDLDSEAAFQKRQAELRRKLDIDGNWWTYVKSYSIFVKFLWPKNEKFLRVSLIMVGLCLCLERVLRVMVPYQLGVVTDMLSEGDGKWTGIPFLEIASDLAFLGVPWLHLTLFVAYRWLDSGNGVGSLRGYFWRPIDQYSHKAVTTAAYDHVMSLSYDFHSNKKTAEIWSAINNGRSLNGLVEMIFFQIVPMLVDLFVAFGYFYFLFNAYMSLIVAIISVTYLWTTAKLSTMKRKVRREINVAARAESTILVETISSWTTVSYFNRVPYEKERFSTAVVKYLQALRNWEIGTTVIGIIQSLIFALGLLCGCFLAVYQVSSGEKKVGSFVTLLTYWTQLQGPLNFFAGFFRRVQSLLLDAEMLLELFQTEPTIRDSATSIKLTGVKGDITFDKICFSYDPRKSGITDMSFRVPAGTTVALVGETGGGKTTCLRLLFRFYDIQSGAIRIDGIDIRDVQLTSLREHMAVVPQDPELFNDSIMANLKYANFNASDEGELISGPENA